MDNRSSRHFRALASMARRTGRHHETLSRRPLALGPTRGFSRKLLPRNQEVPTAKLRHIVQILQWRFFDQPVRTGKMVNFCNLAGF